MSSQRTARSITADSFPRATGALLIQTIHTGLVRRLGCCCSAFGPTIPASAASTAGFSDYSASRYDPRSHASKAHPQPPRSIRGARPTAAEKDADANADAQADECAGEDEDEEDRTRASLGRTRRPPRQGACSTMAWCSVQRRQLASRTSRRRHPQKSTYWQHHAYPRQQPRRSSMSRAPAAPGHPSFLLASRSEAIAQHLGVVDRDLFITEEVVETIPTDCLAFTRLRALGGASSSLLAVDIVGAWGAIERALTLAGWRAPLATTCVHVAWNQWVQRETGRAWHGIGIWEMRDFDGVRAHSRSASATSASWAMRHAAGKKLHPVPCLCVAPDELGELPGFIDAPRSAHPSKLDPDTGALSRPRR
ncbi:hypothetical protein AURDEDRAFT_130802 [Auricularia subglabra TFB-10046 SS5]|uniref:Uncharacterized protein n=1 Tax=Auricularia subglabra (strain TFB-10046 / SS5) TaxID=717982 RepID=J0WSH8_AURST|nr:hypothetical protein AURDEDRAFT_130802 [Auricularia subglabra TFB-10046 SS5]